MTILPWQKNAFPVMDEEDPARRFYAEELEKIHTKVLGCVPDTTPKSANIIYLSSRYYMFARIALLLWEWKFPKESYISACNMINGDILDTYPDVQDSGW